MKRVINLVCHFTPDFPQIIIIQFIALLHISSLWLSESPKKEDISWGEPKGNSPSVRKLLHNKNYPFIFFPFSLVLNINVNSMHQFFFFHKVLCGRYLWLHSNCVSSAPILQHVCIVRSTGLFWPSRAISLNEQMIINVTWFVQEVWVGLVAKTKDDLFMLTGYEKAQ